MHYCKLISNIITIEIGECIAFSDQSKNHNTIRGHYKSLGQKWETKMWKDYMRKKRADNYKLINTGLPSKYTISCLNLQGSSRTMLWLLRAVIVAKNMSRPSTKKKGKWVASVQSVIQYCYQTLRAGRLFKLVMNSCLD